MLAYLAVPIVLLVSPVDGAVLQESGPQGENASAPEEPIDDMLAAMRGEAASHEAGIEARLALAAAAYTDRVEAALPQVSAYNPDTTVTSWTEFRDILDQLEDWAGLIAVGETHALSAEQQARRELLRARLGRTQARLFPRLRYGLQEVEEVRAGIHCHTTADSYLVAICSGEPFQRSSEVRRFQYQMRTVMKQLRFRQVIYQAFGSQPHNYYSDTFDPLEDSAVVIWQPSGQYREVG